MNEPKTRVGTIGHVDHGKTTLTAAITKVLEMEDERLKRPCRICDGKGTTLARGGEPVRCYACGGSGLARDCYQHP